MARIAHVDKDGIVVNVIVAPDNPADAPPPPEGCTAVECDEAAMIGQLYDSKRRSFAERAMPKDRLLQSNHSALMSKIGWFDIDLNGVGKIWLNLSLREMVHRAALNAAKDAKLLLYLPKEDFSYWTLTAKQITALDANITTYCIDLLALYHAVRDDINAGKITKQSDIVNKYSL